MSLLRNIFPLMLCVIGAQDAAACTYLTNSWTPDEVRAKGKAVAVDRQCRTINIGAYDGASLGPAQNLGEGRIAQVINEHNHYVMLADCMTKEATILRGKATIVGDTSCGPILDFDDLTGPDATVDLSAGDDLHELVRLAKANGATEQNPINQFLKFRIPFSDRDFDDIYDVASKDHFDLLCGCNIYYPNSPGASK